MSAAPPDLVLKPAAPEFTRRRSRFWIRLTIVVVLLGAFFTVAGRIFQHFTSLAHFRGMGAHVEWDYNRKNWRDGGITTMSFSPAFDSLSPGFDSLSGEELEPLHRLFQLRELGMIGCAGLTDASLAQVGKAKALRTLNISAAPDRGRAVPPAISAAGLAHLRGLPHLEELYLSGCPLGDESAEVLSQLRPLKTLDLSETRVTDASLPALARLPSLEYLDLSGTRVSAAGLEALRAAPRLSRLRIENTKITPEQGANFQLSKKGLEVLDDTRIDANMINMKSRRDY